MKGIKISNVDSLKPKAHDTKHNMMLKQIFIE